MKEYIVNCTDIIRFDTVCCITLEAFSHETVFPLLDKYKNILQKDDSAASFQGFFNNENERLEFNQDRKDLGFKLEKIINLSMAPMSDISYFFRIGDYYHIKLDNTPTEVCCAIQDIDFVQAEDCYLNHVEKVSASTNLLLQKFFTIGFEEKANKLSPVFEKFEGLEKFTGVAIKNVGAALCAEIYANGPIGPESLTAYYDMGGPLVFFQTTPFARIGAERYLHNRELIRAKFKALIKGKCPVIDIFISHWHFDHIQMLIALIKDKELHDNHFWDYVILHVPKPLNISPSCSDILSFFHNEQIFYYDNEDVGATKRYYAKETKLNDNFILGKIDACNDPHPHHHGIFLQITLASGKCVLLSGDSTYAGMMIKEGDEYVPRKCTYLQTSHHGGEYSLKPFHFSSDDERKDHYIPKPILPDTNNVDAAIYSNDGSTYGHPTIFSYLAHLSAGWPKNYSTYTVNTIDIVLE